jgi:hypothetical protein
MPVINNEFDAYLENKAIVNGFVETEKRERRRPNYFIDEQACLTKEKRTKKCKAEKKEAEKHCLDYDSDDELDQLKSKYCAGHKRFGNFNLNALEKDETKKSRRFIEEESDESDCEDVDDVEKPSWLERAEMKATDNTLINGKEIHLKVTDGQRQLNVTRRAEKSQKRRDALLEVRRDKDIKLACAISNSNNNIMNNSNNTTTTSSNVSNSNNSTITTTTSTNNSGDSNCNNTHNININIHDAGLNSRQGLFLREFDDRFASQRNMRMNDFHHQSLGIYQVNHHNRQGHGHPSLGMYHGHADPFFYNPAVCLPILSMTADMVSSVPQLDLLFHNFAIQCTGSRNAKWLSSFNQVLSIYRAGGSLRRGYNAELNHLSDWCVYQRKNKQQLEIEKQYLLGFIGI